MKKSKHCPSCRRNLMDAIEAGGSSAELCRRCGGVWFDAGDLSAAIRTHDFDAIPPGPIARSVDGNQGPSDDLCPDCGDRLSVYDLSKANPLRVEVCEHCAGVWLPHGNLDRALAGHQLPNAERVIAADRTWANWFLQFLTGLPTEFNITPRRPPIVTYTLVFLNALIHFLMPLAHRSPGIAALALSLDPALMGESSWFASLLTSQFLHVDLIHLLGNMYFLWILGDNVEDVLGRFGFLAFYLAAGVCGGVFYSLVADPAIPAVGASGAISGVIALYATLFRRSRLTFMVFVWQIKLTAPIYVGIWVAFNLAGWTLGATGVAWEAHIGGFLFGMAVGLLGYRHLLSRRPLLRLLNSGAAQNV